MREEGKNVENDGSVRRKVRIDFESAAGQIRLTSRPECEKLNRNVKRESREPNQREQEYRTLTETRLRRN